MPGVGGLGGLPGLEELEEVGSLGGDLCSKLVERLLERVETLGDGGVLLCLSDNLSSGQTHVTRSLDITRRLPDCPSNSLRVDSRSDLLLVLDPHAGGLATVPTRALTPSALSFSGWGRAGPRTLSTLRFPTKVHWR